MVAATKERVAREKFSPRAKRFAAFQHYGVRARVLTPNQDGSLPFRLPSLFFEICLTQSRVRVVFVLT
jgi:hypothetical protein